MAEPGFWADRQKSQQIARKRKRLVELIQTWEELEKWWQDIKDLSELISKDDEEYSQLVNDMQNFSKKLDKFELKSYLNDSDDEEDAIVIVNSGAGGTEACDWAEMLLRMYRRWADKESFKTSILSIQPGDEAGLSSVTMEVTGNYVYGYLKSETGVHRLVRISPFDSNSRRHTSFASVFVYPSIGNSDIDIEINDSDLRIDTYKASGHGGQHVNTTDSAVRITHQPTGITVQCQAERSQHRNKAQAMKMLKSRLYQEKKEELEKEKNRQEKKKKKIEWGSQIRSYVLHPYNMVKDHRTNVKTGRAEAVLDGELDLFINAYLTGKNIEDE